MSEIPDPTPDPTPAPEPEPSEPQWAPDPQEWQQTQQAIQELSQIVQPQPQWQPQQPQGPPIPDPFAEDYPQQFQAYIEYVQAPLRQAEEQRQFAAAQQEAFSTLDRLAETGGAFDRDAAWDRANRLVQWQQMPAEQALEQAAKEVREYEQRVGQQYYDQQMQQLQTTAGAPRGQLPVGVNGTQTVPTGGLGNVPLAVTTKWFGQP